MPGSILSADTNFPNFSDQQSDSEKINVIQNYLYMLLEQLRYTMANLGVDNFNETEFDNIANLITEPVYVQLKNAEGDIAALQVQAEGLTLRLQNAEGDITSLTATVNGLRLEVKNGEASSTISLTANGASISSQLIQFTGVVTFQDLTDTGKTTISGGCIKTGQILATYIKLGGYMDLFETLDSGVVAGRLGKTTVTIDGDVYDVCGLTSVGDGYIGAAGRLFQIATQSIFMSAQTGIILNVNGENNAVAMNAAAVLFNGVPVHQKSSDERLKTQINYQEQDKLAALFDELRPVTFHMKQVRPQDLHVGFIAQDVVAAAAVAGLPGAMTAMDNRGYWTLDYGGMTAVLAAKIKVLEERIKKLEGDRTK